MRACSIPSTTVPRLIANLHGLVTGFDPGANSTVLALALSADEETVYAGGEFTEIGGVTRNYAAALESESGDATDFHPDANDPVNALAVGPDGIVYLGGSFYEVDGDEHNYIAAVDNQDGIPDAGFDANVNSSVYALAHGGTDNGLLAGGVFEHSIQDPGDTELPYVVTLHLAHYADSSTPTPIPAPSSSGSKTGSYLPGFVPASAPASGKGDPTNLDRYGLTEGDTVRAPDAEDPDIYIVNEHGYKRLFLNPVIFSFYGHLGFEKVKGVVPAGRDAFPTSGLFRNCEAGDEKVYAVEVTGEDTGLLHPVDISGADAVAQDPDFFKKVFCINANEFNWYPKSPVPYTALSQLPVYNR